MLTSGIAGVKQYALPKLEIYNSPLGIYSKLCVYKTKFLSTSCMPDSIKPGTETHGCILGFRGLLGEAFAFVLITVTLQEE